MKRSALPLVCGRRGRGRRVAHAQRAAGDRVGGRDVGRAVVGEHAFDGDAVALKERHGTPQNPRLTDKAGTRRNTVGWDRVHVAIDDATRLAYAEVLRDEKAVSAIGFLVRAASADALAGTALDAAELLDVDMDQLARPRALVAPGGPRAHGAPACPSRCA